MLSTNDHVALRTSQHSGHSDTLTQSIAVIGIGTMGRAIASGLVKVRVVSADQLTLHDRDHASAHALAEELAGASVAINTAAACRSADVILLCVKPNDVAQAIAQMGKLSPHTLLVSIAAGVALSALQEAVGADVPVVRAMPNTPCLIGQGLTVLTAGAVASDAHLAMTHRIFSALGACQTLAEKHFDAVTALSASGPAFVYVMIEAMAAGGLSCGLPRDVATAMAARTALGAASMVLSTGLHPAELRDQVSSPGGCTIAGLLALEDGGLRSVVSRAVEVTARTAAGLGKQK